MHFTKPTCPIHSSQKPVAFPKLKQMSPLKIHPFRFPYGQFNIFLKSKTSSKRILSEQYNGNDSVNICDNCAKRLGLKTLLLSNSS